jgi:probable rRNA maturation factor
MAQKSFAKEPPSSGFEISLVNQQSRHAVDENTLVAAVRAVLRDSEFTSASVSIAVVDDATIRELNRRYLEHDWPTDVLSFVLDHTNGHLNAEVIVSADMAAVNADEFGWSAAAEQTLYVVHGTCHLIGYRDQTPQEIQAMRAAEANYLRAFGFDPARQMHLGATAQ